MADFIVSDEEGEELDEDGQPLPKKKKTKKKKRKGATFVDARAMAENFDIFGDADDMLGQFQAQLAEEGGEEGAEARAREAAAPALDPALLAKYHLGAGDKVLRETDLPEREQLGEAAGLGALPAVARAEQAQWVLGRLLERQLNFEPLETSLVERGAMLVEGEVAETAALAEGSGMLGGAYGRRRVRAPRSDEDIRLWRANPNDQEELLTSIREALRLIQTEHLEVPFIAAYRQEQVGPLLALRQEDCPHITAEDAPGLPKGTVLPQHRKIRRYDVLGEDCPHITAEDAPGLPKGRPGASSAVICG